MTLSTFLVGCIGFLTGGLLTAWLTREMRHEAAFRYEQAVMREVEASDMNRATRMLLEQVDERRRVRCGLPSEN